MEAEQKRILEMIRTACAIRMILVERLLFILNDFTAYVTIIQGYYLLDLRGVEPLSESPSVKTSPITVICKRIPEAARQMTNRQRR